MAVKSTMILIKEVMITFFSFFLKFQPLTVKKKEKEKKRESKKKKNKKNIIDLNI